MARKSEAAHAKGNEQRDSLKIAESSGNVYADLGFENPEEELAKAKLVSAIAEVAGERGLTQARLAAMLSVDQPSISRLLRGHTGGFTSDRLIRLLNLLGQDVEISIRPKRADEARTSVSVAHIL